MMSSCLGHHLWCIVYNGTTVQPREREERQRDFKALIHMIVWTNQSEICQLEIHIRVDVAPVSPNFRLTGPKLSQDFWFAVLKQNSFWKPQSLLSQGLQRLYKALLHHWGNVLYSKPTDLIVNHSNLYNSVGPNQGAPKSSQVDA